jgi:hypothetical protein
MTSSKLNNQFSQKHFIALTKKRFKKKFKKPISATDINKIWKDWVQYHIIDGVIDGDKVKIDKHSSIRIVGMPILDDNSFKGLIMSGRMINRGGSVTSPKMNPKRKEFKYKIVYENKLAKDKALYFKASPKFAKQVHQALINTNNYYPIITKK